ncbi:hypothetical protein JHK86_013496 [Glycine max]|nr:hypothetical protein JHK86_013496 [Glycine max]
MKSLSLAFFCMHSSTLSKLFVKESSISCSSCDPTELQSIPNFSQLHCKCLEPLILLHQEFLKEYHGL